MQHVETIYIILEDMSGLIEQQANLLALESPTTSAAPAAQEEKKIKKYSDYKRPIIIPNYTDIINKIIFKKFDYYMFNKMVKDTRFQKTYHNIADETMDIFNADPSWPLATYISRDFIMSKGLALDFKSRFNNVEFLREQKAQLGQVAVLYHTNSEGVSRFVFYMITKERFKQKPTYFHIYCSLYYLRQICEELGLNKLAVPQIAGGLDQMDFRRIKQLIYLAFLGSSIHVHIFKIPNKSASPKKSK